MNLHALLSFTPNALLEVSDETLADLEEMVHKHGCVESEIRDKALLDVFFRPSSHEDSFVTGSPVEGPSSIAKSPSSPTFPVPISSSPAVGLLDIIAAFQSLGFYICI